MKFVDPKSNIAFKKIFGNENKKEILISFLNAVLKLEGDKEILDVTILDPYQAPKIRDLKETILDVRAKDKREVTFIVEMQVEKQAHFHKRVLYYTSKAYVSQIEKGVDYPRLNQVFFIGILNFNMLETDDYVSRHLILDAKNHYHELTDFEFNFIELTKFQKNIEDLNNVTDKWIYFLKYAEDLKVIPAQLSSVKEIVAAFEVAEQHNWSNEELDVYEYWQIQEAGQKDALETARSEGRSEGLKEGEIKGKIDAARKLLSLGVDVVTIAKATGLDEKNLLNLKG